jgi:tetratricopeptide (TPR) repeat protein
MDKAFILALAIGAAFFRLPLRGDITGAVDGLVKDAATGELLEGVKITMVYSKSESMTYSLVSDKKGHFYKSGLVPGAYNLTFEKEGYVPQSGSVRAVAKFSDAITKAPSEAVLYYYRGYGLERSGKSDQTLEDYGKAIELKAEFILPLTRSGIVLAKRGAFDKASEFYRRAVDLKDQDPETFYNYGVCLVNTGKKEEARRAFEKLLALDPYYSEGYYQLAIVLLGSGDSAKAKTLLQKFVELDPDNPNAALAKEILKSLN